MIPNQILIISELTPEVRSISRYFHEQEITCHVEHKFDKIFEHISSLGIAMVIVNENIESNESLLYTKVMGLCTGNGDLSITVIGKHLNHDLTKEGHITNIIDTAEPLDVKLNELQIIWEAEQVVLEEKERLRFVRDEASREVQLVRKLSSAYMQLYEQKSKMNTLYKEWLKLERDMSIEPISRFHHSFKRLAGSGVTWKDFTEHLDMVHPGFFTTLEQMTHDLSLEAKRHCAYIKMGLSNKEIGELLDIKPGSVKRSQIRLKTKFDLDDSTSLRDFIAQL